MNLYNGNGTKLSLNMTIKIEIFLKFEIFSNFLRYLKDAKLIHKLGITRRKTSLLSSNAR